MQAQNYQAINGSIYAGSLSASANPAAIVYVPYAWDFTPFSIQFKQSTNAYAIENYSLLSSPKNIVFTPLNGTKERFVFANQDLHLFNARISLNSNAAIAFGANLHNYVYATSSNANWQDTSFTLADFLKINTGNLPLSAEAAGSTWAEIYGTYAQTLFSDDNHLLNMGLSLKYTRAIAGGFAKAGSVRYIPLPLNKPAFTLTNGTLQYGYSSNFDRLDSTKTNAQNSKAFLQDNQYSIGADIGVEYIILEEEDMNYENKAIDEFAYKTKIGISLTGIGSNTYAYSNRSRFAESPRIGTSDTLLENRFEKVRTIDAFNDSLQTIAGTINQPGGDFFIYQPTSLVINADQHITGNFYLNASLTLPVLPIVSKGLLYIKDMNLLAITPRWETKTYGIYFPLLLNNKKQFWAGAAFKLGPVLLGTHNLANLFTKNSMQSGGGYLAITFRAGRKYNRQQHLPGGKISSREKRALGCPRF